MSKNKENIQLFEELLKGREGYVEHKVEGLARPVKLRPLTCSEILELQKIEKEGMKATIDIEGLMNMSPGERRAAVKDQTQKLKQELDFAKTQEARARVKMTAVSYSSETPLEIIQRLPHRVLNDLFLKVMEISSVSEEELDTLNQFR